ncbi:helix-turn-helix domain-containing protein [Agrobacterium rhizogenes]|nr:helix-turn-helix domain-containing protein [Rhizobium rhizogenes]NTH35981.1 helix-turn-helix domain-containing protein [Rhizobium rhizogenes]
MCNVYVALDPETSCRSDFRGAVSDHPFEEIGISNIASLKQTIARTSKGIRRDTNAYCFLNLQLAGTCRIHQRDRNAITMPGEFTIVDSSEPFLLDYTSDAWEQYAFKIPKHMFDAHIGSEFVARTVSDRTPVGRVVVDFLKSVAGHPEDFRESAIEMTKTIIDLVGLSLRTSTPERDDGRRRTFRTPLRQSVLRYVELNFADPEIAPARVAAHFGVSTRYLHKLLEEHGETFGQIILAKRLERCACELRKGTCLTVSEAAFRCGFNDMSYFSRAFRRHFGVSPRDYRREEQQR